MTSDERPERPAGTPADGDQSVFPVESSADGVELAHTESDAVPDAEPDADADADVLPEPELELESAPPVLTSSWEALESGVSHAAGRRSRFDVPLTVEAVVLTVVMTVAFELFLLIEPTPRWLALFGALIAALGTDGVLRAARRAAFEVGTFDDAAGPPRIGSGGARGDTTPYLFLPTLLALTLPVFAEYNAQGYWAIAIGLGSGLLFGVVVVAEVASVRLDDALHTAARFIAAAATYLVGFALFSLAYAFDLGLVPALIAVAAMSVLLAVELLRDGAIDPLETLVFAAITGLVVAQARWVFQYLPIDSYLGGLSLLLVFYFVTGLVHAYMTRHLSASVAVQYAFVALAGGAMVVGARMAGIA